MASAPRWQDPDEPSSPSQADVPYDSGRGGSVRFRPRNPSGPTYSYRDPPVTEAHPYDVPGTPGSRNSGINPNPTMPQPQNDFDFSTPQGVSAYFASRGVTPRATSPDYWAQKWQEFGQRDPEYYKRFLSNAEEFTGGPQQTAQAMWGRSSGSMGGMSGGGNLGFLLQLLGSRLPQPTAQAPGPMAAPSMGQSQGIDINQIIQQALGRAF